MVQGITWAPGPFLMSSSEKFTGVWRVAEHSIIDMATSAGLMPENKCWYSSC